MLRPLALATIAVTGLLLAGCATATGPTVATTAAYNPDATVNIQVGLEPTSLDITTTAGSALQQLLLANVYEGLVGRDETGAPTPALATDWNVSTDGLTYTFTLRDATFHDGNPVTPADVVWSIEQSSADGSKNPDAKRMSAVASVVASGTNQVVITLASRDINFLNVLSGAGGVVLEQAATVDLANATNGTGPYTVTQWNKGSTITLERFDGYWGDAPLNKDVIFHYIVDPTTAANALRTGEVDLLTGATAETTALFTADSAYNVQMGDSTSWMVLGMNSATGPLADERVRMAISQGIDKAGLISVIGGQAIEVGSISVPSDPWYEDLTGVAPYDTAAAKKLLADAGYSDLSLTLTVSNTYDTAITEYIAAQLKEIGITVTIQSVEFATWLDTVYTKKQYELTMVQHVDPWMVTYYGGPYYWNYSNAEVTQLVTDAREATTLEERNTLLRKVTEVVSADAASDWLYSPQTVLIGTTAVSGYPINRIINYFPVSTITVAK